MSIFNHVTINSSKVVLSDDVSRVIVKDKATGKEMTFDLTAMKGGSLFNLIYLEIKRIRNGWEVCHKKGIVEGVEKTIVCASKIVKGVRREEVLASYSLSEYEALLEA